MDFYSYPHTDLNAQNQAWLIQQMKSLIAEYDKYENPVVVEYANQMTDTTKIYIYQGSEEGMLTTHWYFWYNDTWTDGGKWGTVDVTDEELQAAVNTWLNAHPEATTTVQDGSITVAKFAPGVIDATLTQSGKAADAKATGDAVDTLKDAFSGVDLTFNVPTANQSYTFNVPFMAGFTYTITNNTSAACSMNVRDKNGNNTSLSSNLLVGRSVVFIPPNDDYVAIRGWMNGAGTIHVTASGVIPLISKNTNGIRSNKADAIFTDMGRPAIDVVNRTIAWVGTMYLNTSGGRFTVSASNAYTQLSNYAVYDAETNRITITITNEYVLVYRVSDTVLKVVQRNSVELDDVVLFGEYYRNDYGLIWDTYWRDHYIDNHANYDNAISANEIFNAEPYEGAYDWQTPVVNYGKLFNGKSNVEAFAFFTDSHVLGFADSNRNETKMATYLKRVQKVYNATPCSFIVNGGDWLNNSTTMDEACYRLGYLKGIATHLLDGCKLVVGNHDTNYQGKETASSDNYTGTLTNETIASILFRDTDTKKAYYSFDGSNSKCYVLDSGIEHSTMLAYDWEQVAWLADKLRTDDANHAIIFIHIITHSNAVQTNTATFASLVEAYNNHTSIALNGITYDFTGCTGHVDFWVGGHTHVDSTGTLGGIPYFITASNSYNSDIPLIDLVLVDYDAGTVNLIRAGGTGSDRVITL